MKPPAPRRAASALEQEFWMQLVAAKVPGFTTEHLFAHPRRWRFDFAWPDRRIAVEIQGGVWTRGGHVRGLGATQDAEKLSHAAIRGWRVLVVTERHVHSGQALTWIEQALAARHGD